MLNNCIDFSKVYFLISLLDDETWTNQIYFDYYFNGFSLTFTLFAIKFFSSKFDYYFTLPIQIFEFETANEKLNELNLERMLD